MAIDEQKLEKAIAALQKGDSNALGDIYVLTSKGIFTFVLPILRDYQIAEDVMQQTYISCYDNIQSYRLGTSARNWLLTIAKNAALSELKKRNREVSYDFSQEPSANGVYFLGDIESPTIEIANKVLAEDEFNILMLYAIGDYKHREIADILQYIVHEVSHVGIVQCGVQYDTLLGFVVRICCLQAQQYG
jgi:RNA polymerase sigma-70 factor (ECF subfamily)